MGASIGDSVGDVDGESIGDVEGAFVGASIGDVDGEFVGGATSDNVGDVDGDKVGFDSHVSLSPDQPQLAGESLQLPSLSQSAQLDIHGSIYNMYK